MIFYFKVIFSYLFPRKWKNRVRADFLICLQNRGPTASTPLVIGTYMSKFGNPVKICLHPMKQ